VDLVNLVRGCNPSPAAFLDTPRGVLNLLRARAVAAVTEAEPGTLVACDTTLGIATGAGILLPREVQAESRRAVAWPDYLRGARLAPGSSIIVR
jgi:methionyl-tRNA formyltransferase